MAGAPSSQVTRPGRRSPLSSFGCKGANCHGTCRNRQRSFTIGGAMSKRRVVIVAAGLAVVIATFVFVLPRIADYGDVWATFRDLTWEQIAVLVGATVLNIVTSAPPFIATLPGLGFLRALVVTQASTASTYIAPGGAAVG